MSWIDKTEIITKEEKLIKDNKIKRTEDVAAIKVTISSGKVFDGDEVSQNRLCRVVSIGAPGETTMWRLADNSWQLITWEEAKEALYLAGQAQTELWNI